MHILCVVGGHDDAEETVWATNMFKKVEKGVRTRFPVKPTFSTYSGHEDFKAAYDVDGDDKPAACLVWREFGFGRFSTHDDPKNTIMPMLTAPDIRFPTFPSRESLVFYHNKFGRDTALNLGPATSIMMQLDTSVGNTGLTKDLIFSTACKEPIGGQYKERHKQTLEQVLALVASVWKKDTTYVLKPLEGFGSQGIEIIDRKQTQTVAQMQKALTAVIDRLARGKKKAAGGFVLQPHAPFDEVRYYFVRNADGFYGMPEHIVRAVRTDKIHIATRKVTKLGKGKDKVIVDVAFAPLDTDCISRATLDMLADMLTRINAIADARASPAVRIDLAVPAILDGLLCTRTLECNYAGKSLADLAAHKKKKECRPDCPDPDPWYVNEVESISMSQFLNADSEERKEKDLKDWTAVQHFSDLLAEVYASWLIETLDEEVQEGSVGTKRKATSPPRSELVIPPAPKITTGGAGDTPPSPPPPLPPPPPPPTPPLGSSIIIEIADDPDLGTAATSFGSWYTDRCVV